MSTNRSATRSHRNCPRWGWPGTRYCDQLEGTSSLGGVQQGASPRGEITVLVGGDPPLCMKKAFCPGARGYGAGFNLLTWGELGVTPLRPSRLITNMPSRFGPTWVRSGGEGIECSPRAVPGPGNPGLQNVRGQSKASFRHQLSSHENRKAQFDPERAATIVRPFHDGNLALQGEPGGSASSRYGPRGSGVSPSRLEGAQRKQIFQGAWRAAPASYGWGGALVNPKS